LSDESLPQIFRDDGPAISGGASKTQQVGVRNAEGREYKAHAKFAKDTAGGQVAENAELGLVAELLASQLAKLLGANAPQGEVVDLPDGTEIKLRDGPDGRNAAPGKAFAAPTFEGATDVNSAEMVKNCDPDEVALLYAFQSWIEVQDRGHNLFKAGEKIYSVDHATAFQTAFQATAHSGNVVSEPLVADALSARPGAVGRAADRLRSIPDSSVDAIVDGMPRDWLSGDETRTKLKENLKHQRDAVADKLSEESQQNKGGGTP
jgi:hypothetical protein